MRFAALIRQYRDYVRTLREQTAANDRRWAEFRARQRQFRERDMAAERADWNARVQEFVDAISSVNSECSNNAALIAAEERASVERLARQRLFLPTPGLDQLTPELEAEGFLFADGNSVLTPVYFPDGWRIVPAQEPMHSDLNSSHAELVNPIGAPRAHIFYRDSITGDTLRSYIMKA